MFDLFIVNERSTDVGKNGGFKQPINRVSFFFVVVAGISSVTHGATRRFHSPAARRSEFQYPSSLPPKCAAFCAFCVFVKIIHWPFQRSSGGCSRWASCFCVQFLFCKILRLKEVKKFRCVEKKGK